MGGQKKKHGEFKSQVPHAMLHLNPGVAREMNQQIVMLEKLKNKAERCAENRKERYAKSFEERLRNRKKHYERLIKVVAEYYKS